MPARTSKMLHFLAAAPESPVCALMRELCFTLAFVDDSALHLVLARLEIDPERNGGQRSRENQYSLSHYNESIGVVKSRIESAGLAVHEAIVGVVVNLASYDLFTDNFTRWKMHMLGLQKMIHYRGGINSLDSRTDLVGSMAVDQTPYFSLDSDPTKARHLQDSAFKESLRGLQSNDPDSAGITVLLKMLLSLSKLVAGKSELGLSQDLALMETLHSIIYITLTLPRHHDRAIDDEDPLTPIQATYEAVRLAVILYLSGPVMFVAGNKFSNPVASHLGEKLPKLLKADIIDWTGFEWVELFVLAFGAMTEVGCERQWIIAQLNRTMLERGLRWNDLVENLRSMTWIDIVWSAKLDELGIAICPW
ncbi:unnamed protein product [Clonostachys rosea]|uniref:Acriflavine sensitivity control protein acr-2 n=1 Tax=Bionectria ochroleuca TaxID=29856 RepID=A0ABY6UEA5_BIOOC|nr:unnamed protein product [Clonostachys rosea]